MRLVCSGMRMQYSSNIEMRWDMSGNHELQRMVDRAFGDLYGSLSHGRTCRCRDCAPRGRLTAFRVDAAPVSPPGAGVEEDSASDGFLVRRVARLIGPLPTAHQGARPLRVQEPIPTRGASGRRVLSRQLWSEPGVFLSGATPQQALRWAQRQAASARGGVRRADRSTPAARITRIEQHSGGRPHLHIELPPVRPGGEWRRSGHIFWGRPPASVFFESDDC